MLWLVRALSGLLDPRDNLTAVVGLHGLEHHLVRLGSVPTLTENSSYSPGLIAVAALDASHVIAATTSVIVVPSTSIGSSASFW